MNDNKRLYKKLTTWFWWIIATLPIIFLFGYMLFYIFNKNYSGNFNFEGDAIYNLNSFFEYNMVSGFFQTLCDKWYRLFYILGLSTDGNYFITFVYYSLSWFILVHILHLIVDIILLLPRICQRFIERV